MSSTRLAVACLVIAPGLLTAAPAALAVDSVSWSAAPALDSCLPHSPSCSGRSGHTATLLLDGRLLVTGGTLGGQPVASAELFEPASGRWTPTGSMSQPREQHTATLLPDGRVLVTGSRSRTASAELYDPRTGRFSPTGTPGAPRGLASATLLTGSPATCGPNCGRVLVAGGDPIKPSAELYDPATGVWSPTGPLSENREDHVAVQLNNGRVLIAGGNNFGMPYGARRSAEIFNPLTGSWSPTAPIPPIRGAPPAPGTTSADQYYPVSAAAAPLPGGRVLVAGASLACQGQHPCPLAVVYDPGTASWAYTGSMRQGRGRFSLTPLPDGSALAAGGGTGPVLATSELYNPASGSWTPLGSMVHAHAGHTATLIPGGPASACGSACGRLLIVGGISAETGEAAVDLTSPLVPVSAGAASASTSNGSSSAGRGWLLALVAVAVVALAIAGLRLARR